MLKRIEQPRTVAIGDIVFISRLPTSYDDDYQTLIYELTAVQVEKIIYQKEIDLYQIKLVDVYGREQVYSDQHASHLYQWHDVLMCLADAVLAYEKLIQHVAITGNTHAMYALARYYYYETPTRDRAIFHDAMIKAKAYFQQASDAGHALASFDLSKFYFLTLSAERMQYFQEQREYMHHFYLERSAQQGYVIAQYNLAYYWEYAEHGFEQNYEQAVYWYHQAAMQAYPEALNNLGDKYERGRGVKRDYIQAIQYYQQAAALNVVEAIYNLGRLYLKGAGVDINETVALQYLNQAAQQGYAPARRKLRTLAKS